MTELLIIFFKIMLIIAVLIQALLFAIITAPKFKNLKKYEPVLMKYTYILVVVLAILSITLMIL